MFKSLLTRFKPLPIATLEAGATAGTIAAFTGGEPLTTATLGAVATLALSVKLLTNSWNEQRADETAYAVDQLLSTDRATAIDLVRLFDLPTEGDASNESALLMLATGLQEEIREHSLDQGAIDALRADLAELKEIATDTQATGRATLDEVKRVSESVTDSRIKDETIANLVKQIAQKDARIAELESISTGATAEQIVREAVEEVVTAEDSPEDLARLTPEEVQRRLITASDRAAAEYKSAEQQAEEAQQELAAKEDELVEADRRVLHFADLRGDVEEVKKRITRILNRRPYDLDAINSRGCLCALIGDFQGAEADYRRVESLSGADRGWKSAAYGNLGLTYFKRGELVLAEEMLHKSLAIEVQLGRSRVIASLYGNLSAICAARGDSDGEEELLKKALEISEQLGWNEGLASHYTNLGLMYISRGELARGEAMHRKALAISEELGHREFMAIQYGNLGVIYRNRGELDRAEEMHRKALAIDKELGRREGMAIQYYNLGTICKRQERYAKARELWINSRDLLRRSELRPQSKSYSLGWMTCPKASRSSPYSAHSVSMSFTVMPPGIIGSTCSWYGTATSRMYGPS